MVWHGNEFLIQLLIQLYFHNVKTWQVLCCKLELSDDRNCLLTKKNGSPTVFFLGTHTGFFSPFWERLTDWEVSSWVVGTIHRCLLRSTSSTWPWTRIRSPVQLEPLIFKRFNHGDFMRINDVGVQTLWFRSCQFQRAHVLNVRA